MREFSVRTASLDDIEALGSLWHDLEAAQGRFRRFPIADDAREMAVASFGRAIESPDADVLLILDAQEPVAMALLQVERPSRLSEERVVELSRVVVRSGLRGRGFGRRLVEAASAWARERGIATLMVAIFVANEASGRFWAEAGFEPWVERRVRAVD